MADRTHEVHSGDSLIAAFLDSWEQGKPLAKALLVHGASGVGKTHAVMEELNKRGYTVVTEDLRRGARSGTLDGSRKCLLVDDIDGIDGRSQPAIGKVIEEAAWPVILVAINQRDVVASVKKHCATFAMTGASRWGELGVPDDDMERIRRHISGKEMPLTSQDHWMLVTMIADSTAGPEAAQVDLWVARYRKVGKAMEKYALRAARLGVKAGFPWSLSVH